MPAGMVYTPGETKVRAGVYFRSTNIGEPQLSGAPSGVAAALFQASWGPLGAASDLTTIQSVSTIYGDTSGPEVAKEEIRAGAALVKGVRVGTGGVLATGNMVDSGAANAVRADGKWVGTRGNAISHQVRDNAADSTLRDYVVYETVSAVLVQRQVVTFAKGSGGVGEPQALVNALATVGSDWVALTKIADGTKLLATFGPTALAGGTNPVITGTDYSTGMLVLEAAPDWYAMATDSEDTTVHASIAAFIQRIRNNGKFTIAFVGEPTSVSLATRQSDARSFNAPYVEYVGNGFTDTGVIREGYRAAARMAGYGASLPVTSSFTHLVVNGASSVVGELTGPQIEASINAGMLVFSTNAKKQVQVEYGISTFITPTADLDAGWEKLRRIRTRDQLMLRIAATWDPLVGQVNNNADGRATMVTAAMGVGREMIAQGALKSFKCYVDPAHAPAGDTAYFLAEIVDLDSLEKIFLQFGWQFGGQ